MGRLFQFKFKPARITGGNYVRLSCTLLLLLVAFYFINGWYQKKIEDDLIRRLRSLPEASLTYHKEPLIPVPVKLPFNLPDWFYSVEVKEVKITFEYKSTSVDTLLGIEYLTGLSRLNLSRSRFTGDQLVYLSNVTDLDELSFYDTNVEDDELAYLKNIRNLRILNLHDNLITDKGLVHLKGLKNLESLDLSETEITDTGLIHLSELKKLRNLSLAKTAITGKGLVHLKGLKNLTILSLNDTSVTDAGLSNLNGLSKLQGLYLDGTNVTENEQHIWRIALELRAKKNEGKERLVKPRFSSALSELSHTH
ncbi:Internalin-A precursor [Gimesia panareensis]|uniref:Internalin-A n=1 Tax=Gimesia panareensis TaxID=2527978 RepID=A0A517Q1G5_9PLAN|nr:hypothetical protein [Gimesia panareensis]QDT25467.1 Internalin-A precursor [Gimesia panareensis]